MTHTWNIDEIKRINPNGIVTEILFNCSSEHDGIEHSYHGELQLTSSVDVSSPSFINFENLTKETVLNWVFAHSNKDSIENYISSSISIDIIILEEQPQVITGLPWENI